jgi:hypothetical protein
MALAQRCDAFLAWARQEAGHGAARNAALKELAFPQETFRTGQRDLAEAVYRAAANGRCLLAQAPTGIGKTVGTLFPLLRAMPGHGIDKIAYLTCKGTGRITALEALRALRAGSAGQPLRVLAMTAKEEACEHPDKACHGQACPLARGFYDRLPAARQEAVSLGWLDAAAQRRVALRHHVCPYYLGQELVRWADVLVGDVHHLFDSRGLLWGLMQALDWSLAVLVDEAHNLVERTRRMYSAELRISQIRAAAQTAPGAVKGVLEALLQATGELVVDTATSYNVLEAAPDTFVQALQSAVGAMSEHFNQHPLGVGSLLDFHFELQRFLRLVEALSEHSLFEVQTSSGTPSGVDDDTEAAPDRRDAALCVVMPRALRAQVGDFLAGHAVEAGGLLLGRRYLLGDHGATPLVSVERFVPGRVFEGTGVSLALGTALWDDARPLLDAGLVVVGWVHSHPDLGALPQGCGGIDVFFLHIDLHQRHTALAAILSDHEAVLRGAVHDESDRLAIDFRESGEGKALGQTGGLHGRCDGLELKRRTFPQRLISRERKGR